MKRIAIFDTTLRDGEQSPGCSMNQDEKVRLGRQLQALGVDVIEAGFPIASAGDFGAVADVATQCRQVVVAALCRAAEPDIACAGRALASAARSRIHIFLATSDLHLEYKLRKTRNEVVELAWNAVRAASNVADEVEFSAEDATRSDREFLRTVLAAAMDAGAAILNVPDTVGYATPPEYSRLIRFVRERVVGRAPVSVSAHCHNDLGLAVANTLAAIEAGASQVECTINGIGERAGNAALEEVVMACTVRPDRLPFSTNVVTKELVPTSRMLSEIIHCPVQPNKAVVGGNAFAHEAGIHQHGVMSNPLCYEIMTPQSVGASSQIVLGKHSGRHALAHRYAQLGSSLSAEELDRAYRSFTLLADRKKLIYDQDLLALLPSAVPA